MTDRTTKVLHAPELLEACQAALVELEEWMAEFPNGSDNTPDVIEQLKAAIRGAGGQA